MPQSIIVQLGSIYSWIERLWDGARADFGGFYLANSNFRKSSFTRLAITSMKQFARSSESVKTLQTCGNYTCLAATFANSIVYYGKFFGCSASSLVLFTRGSIDS